jgi:hypothetical protein
VQPEEGSDSEATGPCRYRARASVQRLVNMFRAGTVLINSFIGMPATDLYVNCLRQHGGLCETPLTCTSALPMTRFRCLDRRRITYSVDDGHDVMDSSLNRSPTASVGVWLWMSLLHTTSPRPNEHS